MIDALAQAAGRPVSRETFEKLERFAAKLVAEAGQQNLVSASTLGELWERHILDSAQLARLASGGRWVDIGSGAGLPGIVLAILTGGPVTLIEPRRLRAEFLSRVVAELDLDAEVACSKVERVTGRFDVITARAVASLDRLITISIHLSHERTIWVLPKGRNAKSELAEARRAWHYDWRAEPSITDPESEILLLSKVRAKSKR
jgi:16S rRNA (guanine527-N7)-methyltransferase